MNCLYCHHPATKDGRWFQCEQGCRVAFLYQDDETIHIKFEREVGLWNCALNLYPGQNKTVLTAFHTNWGLSNDNVDDDRGHTHIEIPSLMNVNPTNCQDKIKLIFVFY